MSHRFDSIFTIDIFLWKFIQITKLFPLHLNNNNNKNSKNFPCHFFKEKLIKKTYWFVMLKMDKKIVVDVDRRKLFPHRSKKRSVAEYPANRTVFPPPLLPPVKSISSSAGSTVEVLIVWLRQLMARPNEATKGGNKNAMEGFIGYHWPLGMLGRILRSPKTVPIVRFV